MTRQELNRLILKELSELNKLMPDQRFGQLLVNFNLNAIEYNEESEITFNRLIKNQVRQMAKKITKDLNDALEGKKE